MKCGYCKKFESQDSLGPWRHVFKYGMVCWDCFCDLRDKYRDDPEPELQDS